MKFKQNHWVFDMDGTLTIDAHDWPKIKEEAGLPPNLTILDGLQLHPDRLPIIQKIESRIASQSKPQLNAYELLSHLKENGHSVGILSRNSTRNVLTTLEAAGLRNFFDDGHILGRDSCKYKPDPAGIIFLMTQWLCQPSETITVGDYVADLQAGRSAGITTVYFDAHHKGEWSGHADATIHNLLELI